MDLRSSAQEAVYCNLCETALVQIYCDTCLTNLCTACVGEHTMMGEPTGHQFVRFQSRRPGQHPNKCLISTHSGKRCDLFCKQCQTQVCSSCIASGSHSDHKIMEIQQIIEFRKKKAANDKRLINSLILPSYVTMAQQLYNELDHIERKHEEVVREIVKHGELKHLDINKTVNILKAEADDFRNIQVRTLQQEITAIDGKISSIGEVIDNAKNVLDSQSLIVVSSYESRCQEFKMLPQTVNVKVPQFKPRMISETEQEAMFGSLSVEDVQTEVVYTEMPAALYSSPLKELMEEPEIIRSIQSCHSACLYSVVCRGNDMVFTTGNDCTIESIRLTEKGGSKMQRARTESGNKPWDITLDKDGHLVYTDGDKQTINLKKNDKTQTLLTLDNGNPLIGHKYIAENRNLDICVVDCQAGAVVVLDQAGRLRFRYTGGITAPKNRLFCPLGLATDSQCQILISDISNNCIDVIDQDGQFLRYIDCGLKCPWGICTDKNDHLLVAEKGGTLRKIKYLSN
uniref:Tripartite motif-containing protein 2 n=1 Tax=Magallana gigas TaxID=29159 RepID=K1PU24_MAGGI